MFTKKWFTKRRIAAIRRVIREIDRYKGEPFQPGEHPLHDAVVELESTLSSKVQHCGMFRPAIGYCLMNVLRFVHRLMTRRCNFMRYRRVFHGRRRFMKTVIATTVLYSGNCHVSHVAMWMDARDLVPQTNETSIYQCKTCKEGPVIPAMRRAIAGVAMWVSSDMLETPCKVAFIVKVHGVAYWRRIVA